MFSTILYFGYEPAGFDVSKNLKGFIFQRSFTNNNENIPSNIQAEKHSEDSIADTYGQQELADQINRI